MQFFRLLHRRTKSESDVPTLVFQQDSVGPTAPVFVPLQVSLPSFDPTRELYGLPTDVTQSQTDLTAKLSARVVELEAQVAHLEGERSIVEQDLVDCRSDLFDARTELYSEMLGRARHQQQALDNFRTIQKLEARHQRFCTLLADIGIPRSTVNEICQVVQSGKGSPDDILVDAIKHASNDDSSLLARLKPAITQQRTPEHYQSALNLTLSIRKELKSQKKKSKFWKRLAQEGDRHASTVTPSPSDISSICQPLSPERQSALDALIARRRAVKCSENAEGDVFGGQRRESALDVLASSLASRPRRSVPDELRLSSSFSSSNSSASSTYRSYLSGLSRMHREAPIETPTISSQLPSTLSTSLRRSSRDSSQSVVLGNISLNVTRSSIDPALLEQMNQDIGPVPTVTHSQDFLQNDRRASQGHGHRRMPSTASRRSGPTHVIRSSFRISTFSPIRASRPTGPLPDLNSAVSGNITIDAQSFQTPHITMRLLDLGNSTSSDTDTPASSDVTTSEDTPFNDTHTLPKYDTPLSTSDLQAQVASTPLDGSISCKSRDGNTCSHETRFLEHLDSSMSMTMSVSSSVSASASESSASACNSREHEGEDNHARTDESTGSIPLYESTDSLFTTSASASASSSVTGNETPAPKTPNTPNLDAVPSPSIGSTPATGKASLGRSMLPVLAKHLRRLSLSGSSKDQDRLVDKLRGLSLSRSRSGSGAGSSRSLGGGRGVWRTSPACSDTSSGSDRLTHSPSPVKGSAIPVLQRRMTIRARRTSVRRV